MDEQKENPIKKIDTDETAETPLTEETRRKILETRKKLNLAKKKS